MSAGGQRSRAVAVLTTLVLVLLAGAVVLIPRHGQRTVSAEFDRTVGLFEGSEVRVMGMRVGQVTKITPHGTAVRVDMSYDSKFRLPTGVKAVVIAPSVIADRFVQLTPGYVDGPVLASGAVIAEKDTRVPVELDTSLKVTTDLVTALGPDGAGKGGSLSAALGTVADLMRGNGADTRRALHDLAAATDVLGAGAEHVSGTVKNLSQVTGTLAAYDDQVRRFNTELASVTGALADDSGDLSALLQTLAQSLGEVASFVQQNRRALVTDVGRLAAVTGALVDERQALTEVVDIAPLAFTDLTETYDPQAQAVRTRANFSEIIRVVDRVVCDTLSKKAGPAIAPLCATIKQLLDATPIRDGLSLPTAATAAKPVASAPSAAPAAPTSLGGALTDLASLLAFAPGGTR